jgi:hypothetical protein
MTEADQVYVLAARKIRQSGACSSLRLMSTQSGNIQKVRKIVTFKVFYTCMLAGMLSTGWVVPFDTQPVTYSTFHLPIVPRSAKLAIKRQTFAIIV